MSLSWDEPQQKQHEVFSEHQPWAQPRPESSVYTVKFNSIRALLGSGRGASFPYYMEETEPERIGRSAQAQLDSNQAKGPPGASGSRKEVLLPRSPEVDATAAYGSWQRGGTLGLMGGTPLK